MFSLLSSLETLAEADMAYLLCVDESGYGSSESPYAVLAGVAIKDRDLWNVVTALQDAEIGCFGRRFSSGSDEIKARMPCDNYT